MKKPTNTIEMLKDLLHTNKSTNIQIVEASNIYKQLIDKLPQRFPKPSRVCTKSSDIAVFDATFVYILDPNEEAEPIRMLLSMLFGVSSWKGVQSTENSNDFCLTAISELGDIKLQLVIEADSEGYCFTSEQTSGQSITGVVVPKKFIPFDITREYISAQHFYELQVETAISKPLMDWWSDILERLVTNIEPTTPKPDVVNGTFGGDHDLDFIYTCDSLGLIRDTIDQIYNGNEWHFYWFKAQAIGSLVSRTFVTCSDINVNINIVINNPRLDLEILSLEEETDEYIKYKSMRETDRCFLEFLSDTYNDLDNT